VPWQFALFLSGMILIMSETGWMGNEGDLLREGGIVSKPFFR